jgi:hypothetical protein
LEASSVAGPGDPARRRRLERELLEELELEELDQLEPDELDAVYDEDELGIDPEEDYFRCRD